MTRKQFCFGSNLFVKSVRTENCLELTFMVSEKKIKKVHFINCFSILELFTKIFPTGNAEDFCDHIFRIFDSDGNNFLDFKEFLMALDIAQCTDERQKLEWSFRSKLFSRMRNRIFRGRFCSYFLCKNTPIVG